MNIKEFLIILLVFLAGCSKKTYESKVDPELYKECMRATTPAAFDGYGSTQHIIWACERNSQIRIDQ